jgi:rRNA processing protein Gar1
MTAKTRWGVYPWFPDDRQRVHPEDYERLKELSPYGKVLEVLGDESGYTLIRYSEQTFRIVSDILKEVDAPVFGFEQRVCLRKDKSHAGVVADIMWHVKENKPFFLVRFGSKVESKRYWAEELEAV